MVIDAQILTPYLVALLTAALGLMGFFFKTITSRLSTIAVEIATLIEHLHNTDGDIIDIKKYHNEIIDLKVATAELNERTITTRNQVATLQSRFDETK
jgi:hypothetical protein